MVFALSLGWYLIEARDEAPDTGLVDDRAEFDSFLRERAERAESAETPLFGPIPEEDARKIFAALKSETVYDPEVYYRRKPNLRNPREFDEHPGGIWTMHTNAAGFREYEELPESPDARVVVLGDSHTDGACDNEYSFANVLERLLNDRHAGKQIDVVNAGVGSHSFYNYLGGIEKYGRELDPDLIVCAVYGGNDFLGTLRPRHYFLREPLKGGGQEYISRLNRFRKVAEERADRNYGQAVFQLAYLSAYPEEAALALETAEALTREMAARAEARGIGLVFVYIPPLWDVQLERYEPEPERLFEALRTDEEGALANADGLADRWLAVVAELGLPVIDLRPSFRASEEDLYWFRDYHINLLGQRRVAEALLPLVDARLEL